MESCHYHKFTNEYSDSGIVKECFGCLKTPCDMIESDKYIVGHISTVNSYITEKYLNIIAPSLGNNGCRRGFPLGSAPHF